MSSSDDDTLVRDAKHRIRSAPEALRRHSLRMAALADALADRESLAGLLGLRALSPQS